jgi:glycosyltransferase involved in cell wall biosynthesis
VRIGLHGPIANAAYTLTCGLRAAGYDANYIREPLDRYPMSQPLWEEAELTIDPARLPDNLPSDEEWRALETAHGFAPPWVIEQRRGSERRGRALRAARILARTPGSRRELSAYLHAHAPLIDTMSSFDRLVVSGPSIVDAFLSGTPYVFWPNGGDIRLVPHFSETPYERFLAAAMRVAVHGARVCGTHDPDLADSFGAVGVPDVRFLPFLVDSGRYAPRPAERHSELARDVELRAAGRPTLLMAARQDVRWKGTDRFARAFAQSAREGADLFLAVSPWGNDVPLIRELIAEVPADAVYELPAVVSKPLLADLYAVADVVVDQFVLGSHGSTMLEALATGTTVMIWLDVKRFRARWPEWSPPPLLNVQTEDEIAATLQALSAGELDVAGLGRHGRAWVEAAHGPQHARLYVEDQ